MARRMSELDICSRREAIRLIASGKVFVRGELAELGRKVNFDESEITVFKDEEKLAKAIVLNKPTGYVSGQPEHGHIPAIRLLTRENYMKSGKDVDNNIELQTKSGLVPAGRLDRNSTGLLVFCRDGVLAKKLLSHIIEKEYLVNVGPAHQPTNHERKYGMTKMPRPRLDLKIINRGGAYLLGDHRPLKPVVRSTWTIPGEQLRIVLKEGRKHQIRRMMRELLGFHVLSLERIRIGPIRLKSLPQGKWRPLNPTEIAKILQED